MAKSQESKVVRVLKRSDSVRTTVPSTICDILEISAGDTLVWTVDAKGRRALVTKSRSG